MRNEPNKTKVIKKMLKKKKKCNSLSENWFQFNSSISLSTLTIKQIFLKKANIFWVHENIIIIGDPLETDMLDRRLIGNLDMLQRRPTCHRRQTWPIGDWHASGDQLETKILFAYLYWNNEKHVRLWWVFD